MNFYTRAEVASSNNKIWGFLRIALAIAILYYSKYITNYNFNSICLF